MAYFNIVMNVHIQYIFKAVFVICSGAWGRFLYVCKQMRLCDVNVSLA